MIKKIGNKTKDKLVISGNILNRNDLNLEDKTRLLLEELNKVESRIRSKNLIDRYKIENENKKEHTREYKSSIEGNLVLANFVNNSKIVKAIILGY